MRAPPAPWACPAPPPRLDLGHVRHRPRLPHQLLRAKSFSGAERRLRPSTTGTSAARRRLRRRRARHRRATLNPWRSHADVRRSHGRARPHHLRQQGRLPLFRHHRRPRPQHHLRPPRDHPDRARRREGRHRQAGDPPDGRGRPQEGAWIHEIWIDIAAKTSDRGAPRVAIGDVATYDHEPS